MSVAIVANRRITIPNGALDRVLQAVEDVGANRLPLTTTKTLHEAKRVLLQLRNTRNELHNSLMAPYQINGQVGPDHEAYGELVEKLNELYREEVSFEMPAISFESLHATVGVQLKQESLGILEDIGLLGV